MAARIPFRERYGTRGVAIADKYGPRKRWAVAAEEIGGGCTREDVRSYWRHRTIAETVHVAGVATAPSPPEGAPREREVVSPPARRVMSLEELLTVTQTDLELWEVVEHTVNKWDSSYEGQLIELFQVKARLRLREAAAFEAAVERFLARLAARARPSRRAVVVRQGTDPEDVLVEVSAFDIHWGKLAWGQETGEEDYDTALATARFRAAIATLVADTAPFHPARYLFIVGNDALQADNPAGTTTSGTQVDTDSRWAKVLEAAEGAYIQAIEALAARAPVDVLVVPGNHDAQSALSLGRILNAYFHADARVTVDTRPTSRKYYEWGPVMLGFDHGKEIRMAELPLVMASEEPAMWGRTRYHELHIGHEHRAVEQSWRSLDSFRGVRVRMIPALCATDAWHARKGFIGEKAAAQAFVWSKRRGFVGLFESEEG